VLNNAFGPYSAVWHRASPINYINPRQQPFLILYSFDDLPGFADQAFRFSVAVYKMLHRASAQGQPAPVGTAEGPALELRRLDRIASTPDVWDTAACLAAGGEPEGDDPCVEPGAPAAKILFTGHYAELVAINPQDPGSYPTRLVTDVIASHPERSRPAPAPPCGALGSECPGLHL
jgi:hypothetical protein